MQNNRVKEYSVVLKSEYIDSFRCSKAANSLDINLSEKFKHEMKVFADIESDFNVGLIIGQSGSGKTTLAKQIFGEDAAAVCFDENSPVIDQFPENMSYEECACALNGVGLSSVPCWIRPMNVLSNGQKNRAEIALKLSKASENTVSVIDEWTSVVDRTSAKVMSLCASKLARKERKKIVFVSCHYDVVEWLNPCWIIDCNTSKFEDRRLLWRNFERKEKLQFQVREVGRETWSSFSKYHYLGKSLPGGKLFCYGLFMERNQVGFCCFANYVPWSDKTKKKILHLSRVVISPEYVGVGLGLRFVNICASDIKLKNFEVFAKFSSVPMHKSKERDKKNWQLVSKRKVMKKTVTGSKMIRKSGFREQVKVYSYKYIGD